MSPSILPLPVFFLFAFIFVLSVVFLLPKKNKHDRKRPPGPLPLPLIGNLHLLGPLPHRALQNLAKKYGPIMSLRLGQVPTIVVSSPDAAELILKTHDAVFANRPKTQASEYLHYGTKGMVFCAYTPYWRSMRKLTTLQLLSASKIDLFAPLRREELGLLVKSLEESAQARKVVDFSDTMERFIADIMYKTIFGHEKDGRVDLKGIIHETMCLAGAFNIADFVPWLAPFDLQGLTKRLKENSKTLDKVVERIIEGQEKDSSAQSMKGKDFLGILLSLMNQPLDPNGEHKDIIDRTNIKAVLIDMIAGSFHTSTSVVEWTFSELLKHPRVMKVVQNELESVIGMSKKVEEPDLSKLTYLDMVLKEIFRLHPVVPLLIPHESSEDVTVDGYYIEKKSQVMVNVWAIGRDPKVWLDAGEFYPERFLNNKIDLRGHDFQLIPFGSGRRVCPGMHLGMTTVKLIVAQLIHCFNWELPSGIGPNDLDMIEKFDLTMPRATHLMVVPTSRLSKEVYNMD